MKLAYYAVGSTVSAAGVVIYAFNQRANFYSACVYLAQSNLCLMILVNLILFVFGSFMFGLQRLFYGPLRPIEIEQLYEKAWFAVTETCLAMTIFREEVGAWFLVMFVALLTGKVWGWIGEGRVEILEQQPPANPRLFHARLSLSLGLSLLYDSWLMAYTINTVIQQARPNMMVMFLFEFAILTTSSWSTACRYGISLIEANVTRKQTAERLLERRREVREEREEIIRQRAAAVEDGNHTASDEALPPLPSEDDIEEMDIEVPGWEAKGQWVLTLDLVSDFIKLGIYTAFFFILLTFYGLPIHIMRDLFLTARSFIRRLTAFLRYRRATHDMNERYVDASAEDIEREDTCIICREEMRPWAVTNPPPVPAPENAAATPQREQRPSANVNERTRPKKLPCGHILHLGCLKSWLERQQVCPTCRRPVVENTAPAAGQPHPAGGQQAPAPAQGQAVQPAPGPAAQQQPPRANNGMRVLNLGPLRVGFGQPQDLLQRLDAVQGGQNAPANGGPRVYGLELGFPRQQPTADPPASNNNPIHSQLQQIEQQIMSEMRTLQASQQELQLVQQMQFELNRVRSSRAATASNNPSQPLPMVRTFGSPQISLPTLQRHAAPSGTSAIPSGSSDLPAGVTIPEGWSLLPLQRMGSPGGSSTMAPQPPAANGGLSFTPSNVTPSITATSGPIHQQSTHSTTSAPGQAPSAPVTIPQPPSQTTASQQPNAQNLGQGRLLARDREALARVEAQRSLVHQLPAESRGLAERLLNAETNALRQRASAESLSSTPADPDPTAAAAPASVGSAAETLAAPGERASSPLRLPDWGVNQFYPSQQRPASAGNSRSSMFAPPPPPPPPPPPTEAAPPEQQVPVTDSTPTTSTAAEDEGPRTDRAQQQQQQQEVGAGAASDGGETAQGGKGKARAATVENGDEYEESE